MTGFVTSVASGPARGKRRSVSRHLQNVENRRLPLDQMKAQQPSFSPARMMPGHHGEIALYRTLSFLPSRISQEAGSVPARSAPSPSGANWEPWQGQSQHRSTDSSSRCSRMRADRRPQHAAYRRDRGTPRRSRLMPCEQCRLPPASGLCGSRRARHRQSDARRNS